MSLLLPIHCAEAETEFSGAAGIGYEYDSNVSVDELDRSTNLGDNGLLTSLDLAVDQDVTDSTTASLSYGYSRVDYETFSNLSRQTHMVGANLSSDWGSVTGGLNYFYIRALLDNEDFLTYQRVSPSLSGFVSKQWFLRAAYVHGQKTVTRRPGRNADNDGVEVDAYFFWQGLRRYLNFGYTYRIEDSQAPRFDYDAHQLKLRWVQRFELFDRLSTFELGARYEVRDYTSITPSINEEREDDRLRVKAELEIPLSSSIRWQLYVGYSDYQSNLPSADYEQNVVGTKFEIGF